MNHTSLYENNFWCSNCRRKLPKELASIDKMGHPKCPKCGKRVRTRSFQYKKEY